MQTLKKTLPVLAVATLSMAGMPMYAGAIGYGNDVNVPEYMARFSRESKVLDTKRDNVIRSANLDLLKFTSPSVVDDQQEKEMAVQPVLSNGPVSSFLDLDGPDGELWYYTSQLFSTSVQHQYFTEYILQAYKFDIYDSAFNHMGTIYDKMEYADDEVRVPGPDAGISLLPVVTKNFFNSSDDYEILVGITVNSTTPGVNHSYSRVYSIGGEKVEKTIYDSSNPDGYQMPCDVVIKEFPSLVNDVLDASADGIENFYFGFESGNGIVYYGKADGDGEVKAIHTFGVDSSYKIQGDFENSPMLLSFFRNGKPYVVFPTYREDFFDFVNSEDGSATDDMVMHPGNFLDICLYTLDNEKAELIQTTSVPVELDSSDADVLATYYQVGGFRWSEDVSFNTFTDDGRASFYVTRSNHLNSSDSNTDYCIYVYDPDGNKIQTVFEYADRFFSLSDVNGCNPQELFTTNNPDGYYYNMVDIVTGDKVSVYSYLDTGYEEPELITANVDRIDTGDGAYKYAFEMRVPLLDEDENTIMRVAWLNSDGSLDRIDNINLGKNIDYAQCYITSEALQPNLFKVDDPQEYMVLLKYTLDEGNEEHLLIAQACTDENPSGEELLRLTPSDKGVLNSISLLPLNGETMLSVRYVDGNAYYTDFYKLPLEKTEVNGIVAPVHNEFITYEGGVVCASGLAISIYDVTGVMVAQAYESYDTKSLSSGIYMVVTDKGSQKILVK